MNILTAAMQKIQVETLHCRQEAERLAAQWQFAETLVQLHPEHAAVWQPLLDETSRELQQATTGTATADWQELTTRMELRLQPLAEVARQYTVHCVGHAHIDMNWMWSWPETVAVTNDTFGTVLRLMDEYPDFVFSQSQASVYAIIEKFNPPMLEQIRRRIREKRWEVTASHWVENDKNMVGGEALTRHLLYTRRYLAQRFGLAPEDVTVDWAPDTFGHAATVPTYLARGGVKYCYLHRPGAATTPKAGAFWWEGPDGARILVRNDMANGYNGKIGIDLTERVGGFLQETGGHHAMFVYGVGDHGGGPTRRDLNRIIAMRSWPIFPQVKFSTVRAFFDALSEEADRLPVLTGELNCEFTGCYTTQTQIKKANRGSENRLADAEFAAVLDWRLAGTSYPAATLEQYWQQCLFHHFHDILPGSGVRATRHYTMGQYQDLLAATGMIETLALRRIAGMVDTASLALHAAEKPVLPPFYQTDAVGAGVGIGSGEGNLSRAEQVGQGHRPFVIFNPVENDRNEVIEATVWDNPLPGDPVELKNRSFAVVGPDGTQQPAQMLSSGSEWGHEYVRVAFPVAVPGLGYALYTVVETLTTASSEPGVNPLQKPHHCNYSGYERARRFGGENRFLLLEINPLTGGILRLRDKTSGIEVIGPERQSPPLEYTVERAQNMSAWSIGFGTPPEPWRLQSLTQEMSGPWLLRIKAELSSGRSQFTVIYEIAADHPAVTIRLTGHWLEDGNCTDGCPSLRLPLTFDLEDIRATYEIPFGALRRDCCHDEEVPALQWVRIDGRNHGRNAGALLLNDCKYGYALDGRTLRASLIRSSYDPDRHPELGEHEMNFALIPFAGTLSDAEAARAGRAFNHRLRVVGTGFHHGSLSSVDRLIRLTAAHAVISGIKKAEDGDAVIVRIYETAGTAATAELELAACLGQIAAVTAVDLQEQPLPDPQTATLIAGNRVTAKLPPHGLVSLRIALIQPPSASLPEAK